MLAAAPATWDWSCTQTLTSTERKTIGEGIIGAAAATWGVRVRSCSQMA